jgi:MFS family permease
MLTDWRILLTFNGNLKRFLASWGLGSFAYFGIQGVLLNLYLIRLGYGPEFIGLLIASGQVVWGLMALPAVYVGRRLGFKAILVGGYLLQMLSMALVLSVEMLPPSLWAEWLFGSWVITWTGAALHTVNGIPYLMSASSPRERNYAFAAQAAIMPLMAFAGSIIAGLLPGQLAVWLGVSLDDPAPYRAALWLVPTCNLISATILMFSTQVQPVVEAAGAMVTRAPWRLFFFLGALTFLQTSGEGIIRTFFNVYLDQDLLVPTVQIGAIMGIAQLAPVASALLLPILLARWGAARTMSFASAVLGVVVLPLALIPLWPLATLGFIGVLSMSTVNGTSRNLFSQEVVAVRWRGTAAAVLTIGLALGWAGSAAGGGYLIGQLGFRGLFLLVVPVAWMSSFLVWSYMRTRARHLQSAQAAEPLA